METLLIIVIGISGLVAIAQIVRVFELSAEIKGSDDTSITDRDNRTQGILILIFMIFMIGSFFWMITKYKSSLLPISASLHGIDIDNLWDISMWLIIVVFFITQPLLFGFTYLFRGSSKRKAIYMEHNNKLELFWTAVPAIVLAGLIFYGLITWSEVMNPNSKKEPIVIEIYAKQFNWQARYSGEDNVLGYANVKIIDGANNLGIDTSDVNSLDDIITSELHLPVNKSILFKFRSQDVIHSAYLPHFKVQMNCVPGIDTQFHFVPSITTAEMRHNSDVLKKVENVNEIRAVKGDDNWEFNYILLCNKVCGSAHYNMQMKVVVETEEEVNKWLHEQKTFAEVMTL